MQLGSRHMSLEARDDRNRAPLAPKQSSQSPVQSRHYQQQPRENPYQTVDNDQRRHLDDIGRSSASQMPTTSQLREMTDSRRAALGLGGGSRRIDS